MLGIILYLYFLLIGFIYARFALKDKDPFFCLWIGGILGNLIAIVRNNYSIFIFWFYCFKSHHIINFIIFTFAFYNKEKWVKWNKKYSVFQK